MRLNRYNSALKQQILQAGVTHYEVAKELGIYAGTLSVWLRDEPLPKDREKLILDAIEKLKKDKKS